MKILRAKAPGEMDQIYDERLLKKIDGEQSRRRICGAEVEALISFATGANLIENNMDRLARMAQETGCSTQLKRCRTMAGNLLKQLGKGVSASQLITIANNCNDTTVTISSAPTAGYCNIEWKAMHTLCDAAIDACCWCCDCTRDKSKDCGLRKALETVPGVREAIKTAGNTADCPFAGTGLDWGG